jgi:hypothetical protein
MIPKYKILITTNKNSKAFYFMDEPTQKDKETALLAFNKLFKRSGTEAVHIEIKTCTLTPKK